MHSDVEPRVGGRVAVADEREGPRGGVPGAQCGVDGVAEALREPPPAEWNRYHREVAFALRSVDLLAAPSHAMLQLLVEHYGADLPPTRVVPNGRSPERFHAAQKEPLVLTAGRLWDDAKNVAAVARAASRLPWPVYVAGEQQHPNGTQASLGGCHALGQMSSEALAAWYARAAIYALPARYEPFGLTALEAALSGCALVLGDIESLREVWGDAAIFVPPDSPEALETALRGLIENPGLREEMARRSVARAHAFTPERMARGYTQAYQRALSRRRVACAS